MAKHNVSFTLPIRKLGKEDIEFYVRADGAIFGKLAVSNGSIVWFPRSSRRGRKIGWKRFDELMQVNTQRRERRK